jgi:imidazole glycerol-phosphate synthase subunit HisH
MRTAAIVDYGMCNLDSVARAVEECGARPLVTADPAALAGADRIILPGVGAFPDGMAHLRERGFDSALREQTAQGIPLLGICLGMQLLADRGWEVRETAGLALVPGEVRRLEPSNGDARIPHIGWNEVSLDRKCALFDGIESGTDFYFVHSYHFVCADRAAIVARTDYCGGFTSAVARGTVFGVQFHPEKSQRRGLQVLRNFLADRLLAC